MKQQIFSVFDSKAETFNTPFFMAAKGQALRGFADEVNRRDSEVAKHPEDYTLFHLGEVDLDTGLVVPLSTPASMGLALEFKDETNTGD